MKKVSWFIFFSFVAFSCLDEPDCYLLNNNFVILSFNILGGGEDALPVLGVTTTGVAGRFYVDTLISAGVLALPLNPLSSGLDYNFALDYDYWRPENVDRHLELIYNTQVQFVSEDCGERYVFTGLELASHNFDSVRLSSTVPVSSTTSATTANVDIYRCPQLNVMGVNFTTDLTILSITSDFLGKIYESSAPVGAITLPLNTESINSNYTFELADGVTRRLGVSYVVKDSLVSPVCGIQPVLEGLTLNPAFTDFIVSIAADSIQDIPVINLEITP
jgi:hypothetical protein